MEKIPTAEEFLCEIEDFNAEHCKIEGSIDSKVVQKLKEFAKLHVKQALEKAIIIVDNERIAPYPTNSEIRNCYSLNNIK